MRDRAVRQPKGHSGPLVERGGVVSCICARLPRSDWTDRVKRGRSHRRRRPATSLGPLSVTLLSELVLGGRLDATVTREGLTITDADYRVGPIYP